MKKSIICLLLFACNLALFAQTESTIDQKTVVNKTVEEQQIAGNDHQVISNLLRDNWFVLGDIGLNAYWADYTSKSSFGSRLTPQFNIGFGKWFVPSFGANSARLQAKSNRHIILFFIYRF